MRETRLYNLYENKQSSPLQSATMLMHSAHVLVDILAIWDDALALAMDMICSTHCFALQLVAIDGKAVEGLNSQQIIELMRGDK